MQRYAIATPEGTRDRLFDDCVQQNDLSARLRDLFGRRGFSEIMTPVTEFYEVFRRSGTALPEESMLKLTDRSGRILVLRPDSTTPALRLAAAKLAGMPLPYRLSYIQPIFRSGDANTGRAGEMLQAGAEWIGTPGIMSDISMIALAIEALKACGLSNFRIEIGHAGYFRALMSSLDLPEERREEVRRLVGAKNFAALGDLLDQWDDGPAVRALRRLPLLFGGAEVLDEALASGAGTEAENAVRALQTVWRELKAAGLSQWVFFDLGLVHRIGYYTGMVFRGYADGAGCPVLSGGRYDKLAGAFGRALPAVGFAVDLDGVCACLPERPLSQPDTALCPLPGGLKKALTFLDENPPGSCFLTGCDDEESAMAVARENGARKLVVFTACDSWERAVEEE